MDIIITQWALDSYLDLVIHHQVMTRRDYWYDIRPDVMRLKNYPNDIKFSLSKFWSIAQNVSGGAIQSGYKMKWHQVGAGRIQLRLPIGILSGAFLCAAYVKSNAKQEKRQLAKFKTYLQLIKQNQYVECGRLT